jgi:hypothetical protein
MQVSGNEPHQVSDRRGVIQAPPVVRSSQTLDKALWRSLFPMTPQLYQQHSEKLTRGGPGFVDDPVVLFSLFAFFSFRHPEM